MSFATIVAVLGFAIALVALWLVSDVIKKVENRMKNSFVPISL